MRTRYGIEKKLPNESLNYKSRCCFPLFVFFRSVTLLFTFMYKPITSTLECSCFKKKYVHIKCPRVCTVQAPPSWPPLREGYLEVLLLIFKWLWFNHEYVWLNKVTTQTDYSWLLLKANKVRMLSNAFFIWGNGMWQIHISELASNIAFYYYYFLFFTVYRFKRNEMISGSQSPSVDACGDLAGISTSGEMKIRFI